MTVGAGLAALALAVAGGGYYFFHTGNDTPDYAIKKIAQSVEDHDVKEFHRVVNVDSVLDSGYDAFVAGVTSPEIVMTSDARETIKNFTQILRGPMILSLKSALDSYVATGDFKVGENAGVLELIERTGLNDVEIRNVKNIEISDANRNEAFADVIIFQPELEREFPIQILLTRVDGNQWQVTRVKNFQDYITQIAKARRAQLDDYLSKTAEINAKHDTIMREAEQKYGTILSLGNLGQDKTRAELKSLIDDFFKPDWEKRKEDLFNLRVPKDAEPLHNLYLKICDTAISASEDYSKWMEDRNSLTIKSAEDKIHQVQAMLNEASALAGRMTN